MMIVVATTALTSKLFPIPGSPSIRTTLPWPLAPRSNAALTWLSSVACPTKGSRSICDASEQLAELLGGRDPGCRRPPVVSASGRCPVRDEAVAGRRNLALHVGPLLPSPRWGRAVAIATSLSSSPPTGASAPHHRSAPVDRPALV